MLKHISKTLKSLPKPPNSVPTISHFHTRNKPLISNPAIEFILDEFDHLQSPKHVNNNNNNPPQLATKSAEPAAEPASSSSIQVSHKWPEWIGLMEKLMKYGYFDGVSNPFGSGGLVDGKSWNRIRTACLKFARDRADLMSCFMDRDIEMIAGSGCPSIDRKVVNSGKRLRAHLGIDEGNVCSSCNLRGNCERAYVKAHEDERGHTVDVMRFLLTYALDNNKPLINKQLEQAIRSLTKDMVIFSKSKLDIDPSKQAPSAPRSPTQQQEHQSTSSTIHGGWSCSSATSTLYRKNEIAATTGDRICKFLNSARNIKCTRCDDTFQETFPRSRNNRDRVQLKGDWLCTRCNFFNFAKNTRCLQCHTNPPKRQLNPGEWECDSCNYINFKRNMVCLKCDHKRAKAFDNSTQLQRWNS